MIHENQNNTFEDLWNKYSVQVSTGNSYADIIYPEKELLTLVSRLPIQIATQLNSISNSINNQFSNIYVYPIDTIHTTVLFITKYVNKEIADEETVKIINRVISQAFNAPITVRVRGIGIFPTTIYAQIYTDGMEELRMRISEGLRSAGLYNNKSEQYEAAINWHLSFSNIARFMAPISHEIVNEVKKYRETEFGSYRLTSMELVKTDKFLSEGETTVYGSFSI